MPISVYRELAAELQAAAAMLNSLNVQNQQLEKQNQQLRQEIEKVVQYVMRLQQVLDATVVNVEVSHPYPESKPKSNRAASSPHSTRQTQRFVATPNAYPGGTKGNGASNQAFAEVEEVDADSYRRFQPDATEISGKGLAIAILLVIVTAFGAGYFLVRPLLSSR
ncbi:MAG TPA: hypothetical protein DEV81_23595 [Cyanobacteria bacterium UBA11049]|nr:hypothetical protein [Cyanobacteria bacterium UBA11049]